jgi:hypothetical protein
MRKSIVIICGLILAGCFWVLLHRRAEISGVVSTSIVSVVTNQNPTTTPPVSVTAPGSSVSTPIAVAPAISTPSNTMTNGVNPTVAEVWQKPIDFYGRVIDENTNPVTGVHITFRWTDLTAPNQEQSDSTESDSTGLFSLRGKHGGSMTLWFNKEGYYSANHGQMSFNYAVGSDILSPDPQNPVIFHVRKKGQGVALVTSSNGIRPSLSVLVPINGESVSVDLLRKQTETLGDLELSQVKPDRSHLQQATNWSFHMSIPVGGFIEEDDAFPFTAPETGYQSTVNFAFVKDETNWSTQLTKNYYIAFGQPRKYGWLRVEANIAQQTVFLTYAINPSGLRNLEPAN